MVGIGATTTDKVSSLLLNTLSSLCTFVRLLVPPAVHGPQGLYLYLHLNLLASHTRTLSPKDKSPEWPPLIT